MKKELLNKWTVALRSGEYKQGRGTLCEEGRCCCLGVLGEIEGKLSPVEGSLSGTYYWGRSLATGVPTDDDWCRYNTGLSLVDVYVKNDSEKWSFNKIADWLEENIHVDTETD